MKNSARLPAIVVLSVLATGAAPRKDDVPVVRVSSGEELARVCAAPLSNVRILLERDIDLVPHAAIDSTCGNCPDPAQRVPVTVGVTVSGRGVWIDGDGHEIRTHAGYGVYFEDCDDCGIERATVTGGERDTSQVATDAGVVVRDSRITIRNTVIRDNIGDPEAVRRTVVGITGVCGREGADITIQNCEITRNSWDGVALYRDARAVIRNNYIDGVDRAHGEGIGGGRGVAIGVTWNARARIERNWVRRYWKGIGAFVDADVEMSGNIVEEMLTWGISIWDAGQGAPRAVVDRNAVYDCGACGIAVIMSGRYGEDAPPGRLTRNIVVHTGQNPKYDSPDYYCYQCALALHAVPEDFTVRGNTFHDNRTAADSLFSADATREMFWRGRRGWVRTFRNTAVGVDGRLRFHQSAFLTRYPRWWN